MRQRASVRRAVVAGIFVGGASRRMGGEPKGLLTAPSGGTVIARWRSIFDALGVPCVLVGASSAYAAEGLASLDDHGDALGPLGGLLALLAYAREGDALAVACDMPYVSPPLVARLAKAPPARAVAPRIDDAWHPFFVRYDARASLSRARALADARTTSFQDLLDALDATELALTDDEARELRDWDTPAAPQSPWRE
jgi:molybdenum cofactor guanylyltransferase